MLNEKLCNILGVDTFKQYLIEQLDDIEEILSQDHNTSAIESSNDTSYLKIKYEVLKEIRDKYCSMYPKENTHIQNNQTFTYS